jgi:hypothetical protein
VRATRASTRGGAVLAPTSSVCQLMTVRYATDDRNSLLSIGRHGGFLFIGASAVRDTGRRRALKMNQAVEVGL